jgi:Glycosyltransferase family 87
VALNRKGLAIILALGFIQVAIATLPDTRGDLRQYRLWTRALVQEGLAAAYWPPKSSRFRHAIDYPPLIPYLFWGVGYGLHAVSPDALKRNQRLLDFLIRVPLCTAGLLLALLVYSETRRVAPGAANLALGLIALNPAIIFDTVYWGQADAPYALLVAAGLVALVRGRPEWSWVAIAAAALAKPLAYPFAPLVVLETLKRFGPLRALRCGAATVLLVSLVLLPFVWAGRLPDAVGALFAQIEAMPYVSVNAHNLWWLVGQGTPWTNASARPLGLISWKALALLLFGAFYIATLMRLWRSSDARGLYVAAASTAFGFFVLSTHMHENHLFCVLPLLALVGVQSRPVKIVLLVLTGTLLANMLLHDPFLSHLARPFVPGPQLLLPPRLVPLQGLAHRFTALGYPWFFDEARGETSLLGLLATLANAQVVVLTFVAWLVLVYAGRGFDQGLEAGGARIWQWPFCAAALAFVLGSGVPFVSHALRFQEEHVFLLRLRDAEVRTDVGGRVGISSFTIRGDRRTVLYVHPPSEVRYRLTPPPGAVLRCGIALHPATWAAGKGDGVAFEVRVAEQGVERTLFSRYVDPKRNPADRRWQEIGVDLATFAGREITLIFATTGGPAGDLDFDAAGFSDPTIASR